MVLIALAELGISLTWWTVKGVYSVGRYMIYGKEKTDKDRINELENQLKAVNEKLKEKDETKSEQTSEIIKPICE